MLPKFFISSFSMLCFIFINTTQCHRNSTEPVPEVRIDSKADSMQSAMIALQHRMDSLLLQLSTAALLSDENYPMDRLKNSVYALVNYDPLSNDYGFGTACIVDPSGIAVSNYHVISEFSEIICLKPNDTIEIGVDILEQNEELDYVILQLDPKYAPYEALTCAQQFPSEGTDVFAIGHPEGLTLSLTKGIVSAYRKDSTYIQIDAAINQGNSGGPLLNSRGELIGINSFKFENSENLNFALNITQIPFQSYFPSQVLTKNETRIPIINVVTPIDKSHKNPNGNVCVDKALRAYSNAIIDHNPEMLLSMCNKSIPRFNDKLNVSQSEIKSLVSKMKPQSNDLSLIKTTMEWDKVKYNIKENISTGIIDVILTHKQNDNRLINTHIQLTVVVDSHCKLNQAYFKTLNSF